MAFNLFDFNSIPGTSVQKIGTGASMPSYQSPVQPQLMQSQPVQNTMRFFKDEEEANQKMLQAGLSQEQANELHKKRRNDLLGKISQKDGEALIKMRDAGLRADEAAKLVKQKREETPDTRPLYKKAGEGIVNFMAGNLDTVLKYGGNVLDVATFGQTGIGEEVKGMTAQNKELFKDSTAFKAGSYLPDVALGVSPIGGGYLAGAKGLGSLAARSSVVGGAFGASSPILEKGSDATIKDVLTGGGIGATFGAIMPVAGAGIVKGFRGVKPYITKTLPQNLQVSGQFNRADLTNVSERISKLTGKDIEVDDASRWLLDREIRGDLTAQRKQVQGVVQKSMDDADNLLASKTEDIGSTKEAQALRGALREKLDNYGSYTKEGNFIPSAGNEAQASKMMALIDNPSMSLKEMNNGRRILADGLFNKQGTMKELASKEGWQNVWKDTSAFIEKKAPGFRTINKNTEVGIAIDKAMVKKETAEQTKAMLSYLGLGGGTGGAIGYGTSGGDIGTTIKGIGIGFGVGQLSRVLNSPSVKSNLAYYLNKLSASSRKSIQDLQKGIEIKPENIGKIVEEMKLLPPPSGVKPSAQVSNVKPIISPEAGALQKTSTDGMKGRRKTRNIKNSNMDIHKVISNFKNENKAFLGDKSNINASQIIGLDKLKDKPIIQAKDVGDYSAKDIEQLKTALKKNPDVKVVNEIIDNSKKYKEFHQENIDNPIEGMDIAFEKASVKYYDDRIKLLEYYKANKIPEGYIKNPFNGKIEKINQSKKGSLNIGQIGKDLGLIKKPKAIGESVGIGKVPDELKGLLKTGDVTQVKFNTLYSFLRKTKFEGIEKMSSPKAKDFVTKLWGNSIIKKIAKGLPVKQDIIDSHPTLGLLIEDFKKTGQNPFSEGIDKYIR